ncbi:charged multivesicular body protein 7-like isoform X2 [Anopheles albimanus]|uniref:charged multivesicular body protein 7-like isoform X2 n=1 Tax=Anopheles albimanus TaxID=7167 RepID=UPI00163F4CE5|nr:charged multivesicular body protein 7-like isoform X2 [Anopheles albimanus]
MALNTDCCTTSNHFRSRNVNPESYDSKLQFWKDLVAAYCLFQGSSIVSLIQLKDVFRRKSITPQCLITVFDEMLKNGELLPKDNFLEPTMSSGWGIKKTFERVRRRMKGISESEVFVVQIVAEQHSQMIQQTIQSNGLFDKLINYTKLVTIVVQSTNIIEEGILPALKLLEKARHLTMETVVRGNRAHEVIKFSERTVEVHSITYIEKCIYELEQSEQDLNQSIRQIEQAIATIMEQIHTYIQEGHKQSAKSLLKKKHMLESSVQRKINSLENLQQLLSRIQETQQNIGILEAFNLGSITLKKTFADSGLNIRTVENTIMEMRDVLEENNEVQNMIATVAVDDSDDLNLEQELGSLINMKIKESNLYAEKDRPDLSLTNQKTDLDAEILKRLEDLKVNNSGLHSPLTS